MVVNTCADSERLLYRQSVFPLHSLCL